MFERGPYQPLFERAMMDVLIGMSPLLLLRQTLVVDLLQATETPIPSVVELIDDLVHKVRDGRSQTPVQLLELDTDPTSGSQCFVLRIGTQKQRLTLVGGPHSDESGVARKTAQAIVNRAYYDPNIRDVIELAGIGIDLVFFDTAAMALNDDWLCGYSLDAHDYLDAYTKGCIRYPDFRLHPEWSGGIVDTKGRRVPTPTGRALDRYFDILSHSDQTILSAHVMHHSHVWGGRYSMCTGLPVGLLAGYRRFSSFLLIDEFGYPEDDRFVFNGESFSPVMVQFDSLGREYPSLGTLIRRQYPDAVVSIEESPIVHPRNPSLGLIAMKRDAADFVDMRESRLRELLGEASLVAESCRTSGLPPKLRAQVKQTALFDPRHLPVATLSDWEGPRSLWTRLYGPPMWMTRLLGGAAEVARHAGEARLASRLDSLRLREIELTVESATKLTVESPNRTAGVQIESAFDAAIAAQRVLDIGPDAARAAQHVPFGI